MISPAQRRQLVWLVIVDLLFTFGQHLTGVGLSPPPFPTDKLSVLIVEETNDRKALPPGQFDIVASNGAGSVVDWIGQHGGNRKTLDKDTGTELEDQWVKDAMAVPRQSLPWVVASNGRSGFSEPLPKDRAALIAKLTPLGGK